MAAGSDAESKYSREAGVFLNIMDEMAPQIGLDFSPDSIQRLEDFIANTFDPPGSRQVSDSLILGIGCYVGEVIIRELGGCWNEEDRPEINDIQGIEAVQPIDKVRKRFEAGPSESLGWYYHSIVRQVHEAEQRARAQRSGLMDRLFGFLKK